MSKHNEHDSHKDQELLKRILHILEEQLDVQRAIHRDVHKIIMLIQPKQLTGSIVVRFTGVTMQPNNTLVLDVGQTSQASIMPFLADQVTPSGGVVSNVTYTFNDPSATVIANADGITATVTGVAAAPGPISGSATCTITDTDGVVSQWTQAFTIQVNGGVTPSQLTQSVAVQFSDPIGAGIASFDRFGTPAQPVQGVTPVGQRSTS